MKENLEQTDNIFIWSPVVTQDVVRRDRPAPIKGVGTLLGDMQPAGRYFESFLYHCPLIACIRRNKNPLDRVHRYLGHIAAEISWLVASEALVRMQTYFPAIAWPTLSLPGLFALQGGRVSVHHLAPFPQLQSMQPRLPGFKSSRATQHACFSWPSAVALISSLPHFPHCPHHPHHPHHPHCLIALIALLAELQLPLRLLRG